MFSVCCWQRAVWQLVVDHHNSNDATEFTQSLCILLFPLKFTCFSPTMKNVSHFAAVF